MAQVKPGVLALLASVRNTGEAVAGSSRLVLTVRDRNGALRLYRRLPSDIVLPQATRDFALDLTRRLPAGSYVLRAHMAFGSSHRLEASAPGRLTPALHAKPTRPQWVR